MHAGVNRQAGTTPASQQALRQWVKDEFKRMLHSTSEKHVVINGDLFDGFDVETSEVIDIHSILNEWLNSTLSSRLTLIMGNHDASAKGGRISSFHLLCYMLRGHDVQVVDHNCGFTPIDRGVWAISHQLNQDLFNVEIERAAKAPATPGKDFLLLHCNVMNPFAEQADHALNLDSDQVDALIEAGWTLVVGHVHQAKSLRNERVLITGNQIPSSVADCLGNYEKRSLVIREKAGTLDAKWGLITQWDSDGSFIEVDWRDLSNLDGFQFIRVTGDCKSEEAQEMVLAVSKLRQSSQAFTITNAVKIDGVAEMEGLAALSVETISRFNVMAALLDELDEREGAKIKEIME